MKRNKKNTPQTKVVTTLSEELQTGSAEFWAQVKAVPLNSLCKFRQAADLFWVDSPIWKVKAANWLNQSIISIYIYIYMYVYMYIYAHIHTQLYIYIKSTCIWIIVHIIL